MSIIGRQRTGVRTFLTVFKRHGLCTKKAGTSAAYRGIRNHDTGFTSADIHPHPVRLHGQYLQKLSLRAHPEKNLKVDKIHLVTSFQVGLTDKQDESADFKPPAWSVSDTFPDSYEFH